MKTPGQITFQVTQEHVDKGCSFARANCPIALALSEHLTKKNIVFGDVDVGSKGICRILLNDQYYTKYSLSSSARRFISTFDQIGKDKVKPFKTTIKKLKIQSFLS